MTASDGIRDFEVPPALRELCDHVVSQTGGRVMVVGGAVRDWFLGYDPKDFDVEVYGVSIHTLTEAFRKFGDVRVDNVGASFGVLKVTYGGDTYDFSLPRRDSKTGSGHRGITVTPAMDMSPVEAASRRDFTVNAMGWDVVEGVLLDPYNGLQDLTMGVLRHTSSAFVEDPLRVLRGCQFVARFGFTMAPETVALCREVAPSIGELSKERFYQEFVKLLVKGRKPSAGLNLMAQTGVLKHFPELEALIGVPQNPQWHPEGQDDSMGSLWVHNCMVTDAAVRVLDDDGVTDENHRMTVMLGALCHDLGKPSTTAYDRGAWRSLGHEEAGDAPTRSFLNRIAASSDMTETVVGLVRDHLKPFAYHSAKSSHSAIRRLALRTNISLLCQVARADFLGRTTEDALTCTDSKEIEQTTWLMEQADALKVADSKPEPILMGRHLIPLGVPVGPAMGVLLKKAFEAQLDGEFSDVEGAVTFVTTIIKETKC